MNKQEANEIYHQAELAKILDIIEHIAKKGDFKTTIVISSKSTIESLNRLGYNCGRYKEADEGYEYWSVDWSD